MEVYKLDKKQIKEEAKKFNKTAFGAKVYTYTTVCPCLFFASVLVDYAVTIAFEMADTDTVSILALVVSGLLLCICQLFYGMFLSDFIKSEKK